MVASGHSAVGALVGVAVYQAMGQTNPEMGLAVAFGAGVLAHYGADFIPHGHFFSDKDFKKYIVPDIIFDLGLSLLVLAGIAFFQHGDGFKFWFVVLGMAGSQFPDVVAGLYKLKILPNKGFLKSEHEFHESMHWHGIFEKGKLVDGLPWRVWDIWQIIVIIAAIWAVYTF
jgi:hypothetical protein